MFALGGCTFGSSGASSDDGPLAEDGGQTSSTSDDAGLSGPASQTSGGSAEGTSAGSSPTSAGPGGPGDGASGDTVDPSTTSGADSGSDGVMGDSTTGTMPMTEALQNAPQAACDGPFWCVYNGNPADPTGGPLRDQECFSATLTPPFALTEVHYEVWMAAAQLGGFDLEVRQRNASGPGPLIASVPLNPGQHANQGSNTLQLNAPITIETGEFCVGFSAAQPGLQSALGIAVDTSSAIEGVSYLDLDTNCSTPGFVDVIATYAGSANGVGNWCIDVVIEK